MGSWVDKIDRSLRMVDSVDDLIYMGALGASKLTGKFRQLAASPILRGLGWLGRTSSRLMTPLAKPLLAYEVGKSVYGATRYMYENPNIRHPINENAAMKMSASWGDPVPYFPTNMEMGMNPEVVAVGWDNTKGEPILEHNGVRKPLSTLDPHIVKTLWYNKNKLQKIGPKTKVFATKNLGVPAVGFKGIDGYSVPGQRIDMGRAPNPKLKGAGSINTQIKFNGLK